MRRRIFGCLILVVLVLLAILILVMCRAREQSQPLPPSPTPTPMRTLPPGQLPTPTTTSMPGAAVTSVTASVSPSSFAGECPKRFNFSGVITVEGPSAVFYQWERSDGAHGSTQMIPFTTAGSRTVSEYWELSAPGTHWMRLHVLRPNDLTSNQATFTLKCEGPPPSLPVATASPTPTRTRTPTPTRTRTPTPTQTPPPVGQPPLAPIYCTWQQIDTRTIRIEWQPTGQAEGFRIYQGKTSLEATVGPTSRSWSIADLPPSVQHHFDVRAYNASGESRADACAVDVTRR